MFRPALAVLLLPLFCAGRTSLAQPKPRPLTVPGSKTVECVKAYRVAAERYRAGEAVQALALLNGLDHEELKTVVGWLNRMRIIPPEAFARLNDRPPFDQFNWRVFTWAWDRTLLGAAGMLHVEAALAAFHAKIDEAFHFHSTLAADVLAIADQPRPHTDEAAGTWGRRTALAMGLVLLGNGSPDEAHQYLTVANRRFPDDTALLVLGIANETRTAGLVEAGPVFDARGFAAVRELRDRQLRDAAATFERALALDPSLAEARVRLARVRISQHNDAAATVLLEQALAAHPARRWAYLAALMLGSVRQRAGQTEAAIHLYADAIASQPEGQSAFIAMSHAKYAAGDRESAAGTLERLFALRLGPNSEDPWWDYPFGDWKQAEPMLDALRAEVRR